jgi:DNA mismatch repair protein MutS2
LVKALEGERARAEDLKEVLRVREDQLKDRERTARARAQEDARKLLLEARREVEEAIRDVRAATEGVEAGKGELETAEKDARRRVEEAARRHQVDTRGQTRRPADSVLEPGDRVSLSGTGSKGTVVEVREDRVVVETAGVRLQVPASDLVYLDTPAEVASGQVARPELQASSWQGPDAEPETEIDVRGLRVAEVGYQVDRALDQAVLAGLGELRIIHGKGTGALRKSIAEMLETDVRVGGFRMGGPAEGGAGVTVVRLR